jgi:hypothetical protein
MLEQQAYVVVDSAVPVGADDDPVACDVRAASPAREDVVYVQGDGIAVLVYDAPAHGAVLSDADEWNVGATVILSVTVVVGPGAVVVAVAVRVTGAGVVVAVRVAVTVAVGPGAVSVVVAQAVSVTVTGARSAGVEVMYQAAAARAADAATATPAQTAPAREVACLIPASWRAVCDLVHGTAGAGLRCYRPVTEVREHLPLAVPLVPAPHLPATGAVVAAVVSVLHPAALARHGVLSSSIDQGSGRRSG